MGHDPSMIALDSDAMTKWIDAMGSITGPPNDPEKIALARIFFWMPNESCFHYLPTVEAEYQRISDPAKLDNHVSWVLRHISCVMPLPDSKAVQARVSQLLEFHSGENDCKILAESELTEIETLITCDTRFLKHLPSKARVRLCSPSEYWDWMSV